MTIFISYGNALLLILDHYI